VISRTTETSFLTSSDRVYHFTPQTEQAGVRWKHPTSPTVSVFWDAESVIHVELVRWCRWGNLNASWDTLLRLRESVSSKETWASLVRFDPAAEEYDTTQELFQSFDWKLLDHISVGIMPRRTYVFGLLKPIPHSRKLKWLFLKRCECEIRFLRRGNFKTLAKMGPCMNVLGCCIQK
jgi:hypothetical protein